MFSSTPRCQHVIITDTNKPINIYKCSKKKKIQSIDCLHKHDNTHFTVHNLCRKRIFFTRATFIFVYHRVYNYCVNHKYRTLGISRNDSHYEILVNSRQIPYACNISFCSPSDLIQVNYILNIRIDFLWKYQQCFIFQFNIHYCICKSSNLHPFSHH